MSSFSRPLAPSWMRLMSPLVGTTVAALALAYTSSPLELIVVGIFGLAAGVQLGVPSANGRRFGLPVAVAVSAPILLVEGGRVDLPSVLVVYGTGMAIGNLLLSIRPTSKASAPSVLRTLIGMVSYTLVFAALFESSPVEAMDRGWGVMVALGVGAAVWLTV
ncbi:MAG TPA: hypothetical protein VLA54_10095, partial [Acidimicrobiia bacterium]|nr:hypothetical protein [Acidimicrobiia bacterium]